MDNTEYTIPPTVLKIVEMLAEKGMLQVYPLVIDRDHPSFKAFKMPGIGVIWNEFKGSSTDTLETGDLDNSDSELVDIAYELTLQGALVTGYSSQPETGEELQAVVLHENRLLSIEVTVAPEFHRRQRDVPHDQCGFRG
jgi:hypothetical protein